jgi:hypothetical protein
VVELRVLLSPVTLQWAERVVEGCVEIVDELPYESADCETTQLIILSDKRNMLLSVSVNVNVGDGGGGG